MNDTTVKIRILLAEDNPAVREFVVRALQSPDTDVVAVADGQQALDQLARAPFDVLITDIVMPNVDGITLALKVGQTYPSVRIVMISGYAQERMRAHNLDVLVHKIIPKPFSLEEIVRAIDDVMSLPPVSP